MVKEVLAGVITSQNKNKKSKQTNKEICIVAHPRVSTLIQTNVSNEGKIYTVHIGQNYHSGAQKALTLIQPNFSNEDENWI